jgi:cellobiose-specific phosphotransferase system component IIA
MPYVLKLKEGSHNGMKYFGGADPEDMWWSKTAKNAWQANSRREAQRAAKQYKGTGRDFEVEFVNRELTKLEQKAVSYLRATCERLKIAHRSKKELLKEENSGSRSSRELQKSLYEIEAQYHVMSTAADVVVEIFLRGPVDNE